MGTELMVHLSGEVDLCLRPQLLGLTRRLAGHNRSTVVDLSGVKFADGTLAGFLAAAVGQGPVTVRASTRLARELLRLYGLDRDTRVVA
jgi:anti-anti-sigma regulatory factor